MSRLDKLIEKFLRRPSEVSFREVEYVLRAFGYDLAGTRGKHPTFVKIGYPTIIVPLKKGRHRVKGIYVM